MTRTICVLAFVLIVALTGFTTPVLSAPSETEVTPVEDSPSVQTSVTPATQEDNETITLPPGTSQSGITNATLLLETHQSQLENTTYAERIAWPEVAEVSDGNGTFLGFEKKRYTMAAEQGSNSTWATLDGKNTSREYWMTATMTASRIMEQHDTVSETEYSYTKDSSMAHPRDRGLSWIGLGPSIVQKYLAGVEYEYAGTTTRANDTLYEFEATGINETAVREQSGLTFSSSIDQINATVLVDQQGVIRSMTVSETRSRENETLTAELQYTVETSEQSPTRPEWVSAELPQLNASVTGNGTVIALEHTGGLPISVGSFTISSPTVSARTAFLEPFEPGDTFYLYQTQTDANRVNINWSDPPEVDDSFVDLGGDTVSLTVRRTADGTFDQGATVQIEVHNDSSARSPGSALTELD